MTIRTLLILSALLPTLLRAEQLTAVSRNGITWTFDGNYECGRFITGDWWVVGPVSIIGIDPPCCEWNDPDDGPTVVNGAMIDPVPGSQQGYRANIYGYDASVNAAIGVSAGTPLVVSPGSRLISSVHYNDSVAFDTHYTWNQTYRRDAILKAAILTVVAAEPPDSSFRPGYCDSAFTVYPAAALRTDLLQNLTGPDGLVPDIDSVAAWFEHPWLEHKQGWSGSHIHPQAQMPFYGREISRAIGFAGQMLHLDIPLQEKMPLLYRYIQYGIDVYSVATNGGATNWINDGGHASGRKWPVLFTGYLLEQADMLAVAGRSGDYLYSDGYGPGNVPPDYIHFGEDDQTFYVSQEDIDRTNSQDWSPDTRAPVAPYSTDHIGLPEWGIGHSHNPWADNASWDANYRRCCTANAWQGWILAAYIMDAKDVWNHDALFDYMDRYMAMERVVEPDWRCWDDFTEGMWDTYRAGYGCVWTMTDTADTHSLGTMDCSRCEYNCTGIRPADAATSNREPSSRCRVSPHPVVNKAVFTLPFMRINTDVSLRIYDHNGTLVYHAMEPIHEPTLSWDGNDRSGRTAPAGIYTYTIRYDEREFAGRIIKSGRE